MIDLEANELAWLLGLAARQRRKREREIVKAKPGQPWREVADIEQKRARAILFAKETEDKLILMVAERDAGLLREEHRARFVELERANLGAPHVYLPVDGENLIVMDAETHRRTHAGLDPC